MGSLANSRESGSHGGINPQGVVCLFPVIGHTSHSEVRFDPETPSALLQLSGKLQIGAHVLLSAIWATVLGRYTDADTTRFELFVEAAIADNGYIGREVAITVDSTAPMTSLLQKENWVPLADCDHDRASYNTKVFILKMSDDDEYTIAAQLAQRSTQVRAIGHDKVPSDFVLCSSVKLM
ncbi:nonribosomal peptide synthetase 12 [Penicillium mononematosum]|uniref:nonribosomal peptide synthetase 12 n=1 Tax=Penicillium mononematosum TaxID=268346 RepID=UPI0025470F6A|nr:nonribosomal peptide synthetase 12 [Penicillium mononematosum]KAJ6186273.1 nonribosomal peptide synthetase 12 [Penicillium mononematosum]